MKLVTQGNIMASLVVMTRLLISLVMIYLTGFIVTLLVTFTPEPTGWNHFFICMVIGCLINLPYYLFKEATHGFEEIKQSWLDHVHERRKEEKMNITQEA